MTGARQRPLSCDLSFPDGPEEANLCRQKGVYERLDVRQCEETWWRLGKYALFWLGQELKSNTHKCICTHHIYITQLIKLCSRKSHFRSVCMRL